MSTKYKINQPENAEMVVVKLTESKYPILFSQKVDELIEDFNISEEEARKQVEGMVFNLELCYQKSSGLFAIESEAIECYGSNLFNPYTGENLVDCDEDTFQTDDEYEFD